MKQYLCAFQMFLPNTSFGMKLLLYIIYPVMMTGTALRIGFLYENLMMGILAEGTCIIGIEFFLEWYLFSMIGAKHTRHLDYIKTSPTGVGMIEKALFADVIRRGITVVMVQIFAFRLSLIWEIPTGSLSIVKLCTASVYMILYMEIGSLLIRAFGGYLFLCLCVLCPLLYLVGAVGILSAEEKSVGLLLFFIGVNIAAIIGSVAIVMNQIRGEHYDKRD